MGAAVDLADDHGLAAVSIRGVAARLGVAPMTLYGHVKGSDELVDLVVGATIAGAVAAQPPLSCDGRGALMVFAHGLRTMLLDHPAVLAAFQRRPVQSPTGVAVAANVLTALMADGLSEDDAVDAYATVYAFVVGFVSLESRSVAIDPDIIGDHPTLQRLHDRLGHLFDPSAFERGLTALVDAAGPGSTP